MTRDLWVSGSTCMPAALRSSDTDDSTRRTRGCQGSTAMTGSRSRLNAQRASLRASEVCNLRMGDVDLKNGSIRIERLKGSLRTTQALTEHRGEPLLNEIRAIREWLRERHDDGSDYLFTSQKGGRLHRSQFFRLFRALATAAKVPATKRHPHVLKHSVASHLVSANVNVAVVKQQLGHKSIRSTIRYVGVTDLDASKATYEAMMRLY